MCECYQRNGVYVSHTYVTLYIQKGMCVIHETSTARWFNVTFLSPIWRSLNLRRGLLTIPKRAQRIARCTCFRIRHSHDVWFSQGTPRHGCCSPSAQKLDKPRSYGILWPRGGCFHFKLVHSERFFSLVCNYYISTINHGPYIFIYPRACWALPKHVCSVFGWCRL